MTICNGVYTERQGRAMLNIGRWFSFSSPEERKEREEAYLQTVFPFGEAQKQMEQGLLKTCVQAPVNENEKLYQLLVVKGLYAQTRPEKLEDTLGKWYRGALLKKWPDSAWKRRRQRRCRLRSRSRTAQRKFRKTCSPS